MGKEQEPQSPKFVIDTGKEKLICTPENTMAFLYEDEQYDHLFYIASQTEDSWQGYHIFRHVLGEQFNALVMRMINEGYAVNNEDEITETDLDAYNRSKPKELEVHEVSQRGENKIAFLGYLLVNEYLTADDFNGENEMYI